MVTDIEFRPLKPKTDNLSFAAEQVINQVP